MRKSLERAIPTAEALNAHAEPLLESAAHAREGLTGAQDELARANAQMASDDRPERTAREGIGPPRARGRAPAPRGPQRPSPRASAQARRGGQALERAPVAAHRGARKSPWVWLRSRCDPLAVERAARGSRCGRSRRRCGSRSGPGDGGSGAAKPRAGGGCPAPGRRSCRRARSRSPCSSARPCGGT